MNSEQIKKPKSCFAIAYEMAKQSHFRQRSSAKSHAAELMREPLLLTALLSLAHLPRAIRLARKPAFPAVRPESTRVEPAWSAEQLARVDASRALRTWSAEHVGHEESLDMLAGYVVDPQSITLGRWRTMGIAKVCGYREEIWSLFDKIHEDPELSAFRDALRHRLYRRRGADRILRGAWPEVESEAKRFAVVRERRRIDDSEGPREPEDRFGPGRSK